MKRSEWSDKQLEELLQSMPKIEDHRDPRDIYQNILLKMNKKKQRTWILPSIATAAAVLLLAILAPSVLNSNDSTSETMDRSIASESSEQIEMSKVEEDQAKIMEDEEEVEIAENENNDQQMHMTSINVEDSYTALYEADVKNENVFTFVIPDIQAQNVVPVTVVVPKEDGKQAIDQLNDTMPQLQEEAWGLSDYYPLNAQLSLNEEQNVLEVNVPAGHYYGDGSASENIFVKVVKEAASSLNTNKVTLFTDNNPGIEFGNQGNITELDVTNNGNHAYYFYFTEANTEKPYLVPFSEPFTDIESALEAMKKNIDTHGLRASIPENLSITEVNSSGEEVLTLQFNEDSNITEEPSMIHTIEAILLTAKEFQYDKVRIEYNKLDKVGKFNFNEELELPIAPNRIELAQ